jgi:hypothetical protein
MSTAEQDLVLDVLGCFPLQLCKNTGQCMLMLKKEFRLHTRDGFLEL